jgi:hypothetical protein
MLKLIFVRPFLSVLTLLLVFGVDQSKVKAQIILEDDFEKASLDKVVWDVTWWTPDGPLDEGIEPEIVDSPVRAGSHAVKIRAQANWNGHANYSRTEILGKRNDTKSFITFFYPGKKYWIGISVCLPDDWQTDIEVNTAFKWATSSYTTSHDVYLETTNLLLFVQNQSKNGTEGRIRAMDGLFQYC